MSKLVPPTSAAIAMPSSSRSLSFAAPTTPAAGPEMIVSTGREVAGGELTGTVSFQAGMAIPYQVTVTADNGNGTPAKVAFNWTVQDSTAPAIVNPGPQSNNEGNIVGLFVTATDVDGDPLTYSAVGLPAGLSIDSHTGLISGTVGNQAAGGYQVTVSATDGTTTAKTAFSWTITDITAPAIVNPGPQSSNEGNSIQLTIVASDADGDPLTFAASGFKKTVFEP